MRRAVALGAFTLILASLAGAQPPSRAVNPNRAALEQQWRERSAQLAKQKLGLTDDQLTQLEQSNARFAPRLNQLALQDRETRRQLRLEMTAGSQANQQHVSALLDSSISLQKQRIAVVEEQQKDLARFLTPTQRAGYIALQAQVRRRAQELQRKNNGRGAIAPMRGMP
jgi:periplasmic protein CpxP/Spy